MDTILEQFGDVAVASVGIAAGFAMLISCFALYTQTAGQFLDAVLYR